MRLRYAWIDLIAAPLLFLLLASLAWRLVEITLGLLGYPTSD